MYICYYLKAACDGLWFSSPPAFGGYQCTCGQVWWPILRNCALHLTHPRCTHTAVSSEQTHTPGAHQRCGTGEQSGVRCLAQGSHLSRGIEGGESAGHSLPPPTNPAGPETRTCDLWVTSPTLYPLGHDCPPCITKVQDFSSSQSFFIFILHFYAFSRHFYPKRRTHLLSACV